MVANAYSTAALSGAPMQQAVDVIEPLRAVCMTSTDAYDLGDAFVAAILKVVGEPLLPIAQNLRDRRNATIVQVALQLVADEILAESGHAEHEWLRAFGEALAAYELTICARLIEGARESSIAEGWIPRLDAATNAARQESWAKFGPAIDLMLAEDIWEDVERAPLLAMQSQIQLYIFENGPEARRLADEAVRRAPGNVRAIEALAYVHLNAGRREEAEGLLLEAVESQPNSGLIQAAYSYCAEYSGDTDAAEERLLDGLRQAPYSSALITRMLNLYCTEKFFVVRETRIPFLAAQVVAVDPDAEYGIYLVIARAHSKNKQSDGARDILNRLVATNPGRVEAHVELARLELADGRAEVSKAHLRDALAVDPVCLDAATVFAEVCDALHDVEGALEWNSRAVSWTIGNPGLAEAGLALRQAVAGMDEAAWASATRAVGAAPDDGRITDLLAEMISARWTTNPDDVRSLLRIVLDNRGEKFLAEYHNLVGIAAYQAQDNNSAVSEFHTALELAPDKAVYHSNLGRALRELGRWDEARSDSMPPSPSTTTKRNTTPNFPEYTTNAGMPPSSKVFLTRQPPTTKTPSGIGRTRPFSTEISHLHFKNYRRTAAASTYSVAPLTHSLRLPGWTRKEITTYVWRAPGGDCGGSSASEGLLKRSTRPDRSSWSSAKAWFHWWTRTSEASR